MTVASLVYFVQRSIKLIPNYWKNCEKTVFLKKPAGISIEKHAGLTFDKKKQCQALKLICL